MDREASDVMGKSDGQERKKDGETTSRKEQLAVSIYRTKVLSSVGDVEKLRE